MTTTLTIGQGMRVLSHTQGHLILICPCAHKIHMCGERRREKKENALFDWKDDNEGEEMRKTKDTFGRNVIQKFFTCVENRYRFLACEAKGTKGNKLYVWEFFFSLARKTMEALNILICSGFYDPQS
jgi:hypothetical protein